MAEIRKFDPKVTGRIDAAILAALGEEVRYTPPGTEQPRLGGPDAEPTVSLSEVPAPSSAASWLAVPVSSLPRMKHRKPTPDDDDLDDDDLDDPAD